MAVLHQKRKQISGLLGAAPLGLILMLTGASAHAQSAGLRLMPIGDSVTAGYQHIPNSNNGYRGPLYRELTDQGDAVDFVGSQRHGVMFDPDNEGYNGYRIDQIAGLINDKLATYHPNIITLHIGTNDLGQNYQVSTAPARLAALIDQILAADPNVTLLVAQIIPSRDPNIQALTNTYNAQIPGIVQARAKAGKHVYMVSMSALSTASDFSDNIHPNDAGYQKMADAWDASIQEFVANGWVTHINFAGNFEIQCKASGLAVDVAGGSTSNNAPIIQYRYQANANQLWNFIPTSHGYYQIKNAYSGLDMNVSGASKTNTTATTGKIVQWPFGSQGNDQWLPVRNADGSYLLYNRNSGLVLDDPGGNTAQNVQFGQWGANGGPNQRFNVIRK